LHRDEVKRSGEVRAPGGQGQRDRRLARAGQGECSTRGSGGEGLGGVTLLTEVRASKLPGVARQEIAREGRCVGRERAEGVKKGMAAIEAPGFNAAPRSENRRKMVRSGSMLVH
jgi:hypothetical protein